MLRPLVVLSALAVASCDVSHIITEKLSTAPPPPRPYAFAYTAGRFPGHADRHHAEVSDGSGQVRGTFSYIDPRQKLRRVDYVADKDGFRPVLSEQPPDHPADSAAVAKAKKRHYQLYDKIAAEHALAHAPHPIDAIPRQTVAVAKATENHATLFKVIAEQHARIAAEREALQQHDEDNDELQELNYLHKH